MHPLVRMQRDAMLQARKVQAGNEVDTHNPGFPPAPERSSSVRCFSHQTIQRGHPFFPPLQWFLHLLVLLRLLGLQSHQRLT